jgi:adenylate cyclase
MDLNARLEIMNWLAGAGLSGIAETDLVREFCERTRSAGLELSRGLVFIDTLHPIFEGQGFRWTDVESNESDTFEYGSTSEGEAAETGSARLSTPCCRPARTKCDRSRR